MSNVLPFAQRPAPPPDQAGADDDPRTRCIRAAAALAQACADWSMALLCRPCLDGAELLIEAKLLVRDLLLVGGIVPPNAGELPVPTAEELTIRIRALKEKAFALGVLIKAPPR